MQRPIFLTFLCLITFTWNAINLFTNVKIARNANYIPSMIEDQKEQIIDLYEANGVPEQQIDELAAGIEKIASVEPSRFRTSSIISIVSCLLIIFGAVKMWDMKKVGYSFYIAGILLGIIAPMISLGFTSSIGFIFIGALGAILYYTNLKYMS